jgi:thiol-disulfide isomerase/thioredoxin
LLIKDVVQEFEGKVKFVSQDWGTSELSKQLGIRKYPVVFVGDVLFARPEEFGGWGAKEGKYAPWREKANQARFKTDLAQMVNLVLEGKRAEALKLQPKFDAAAKEIGELPNFALTDINGKSISSMDLAGKVVIVDFWATWCGNCRPALKFLSDLKKVHGEKVAVLALALDSEEADIRKLTQTLNPAVNFVSASENQIAPFGIINSVPTMLIFDQSGKFDSAFYGAPKDLHERVGKSLDSLLK